MQKPFRFLSTLALFSLYPASPACGQSPQQFDCAMEKDPFFSYCTDISKFLSAAAAHKDAGGKIDRANPDTIGAPSPRRQWRGR